MEAGGSRSAVCSVLLLLVDVVVEQLDDQVDVRQDHAPAAVPLAAELVERFSDKTTNARKLVSRSRAMISDKAGDRVKSCRWNWFCSEGGVPPPGGRIESNELLKRHLRSRHVLSVDQV